MFKLILLIMFLILLFSNAMITDRYSFTIKDKPSTGCSYE